VRQIGSGILFSVAFSPDAQTAVLGGMDGSVRLVDIATGQQQREIGNIDSRVWTVGISQDGQIVLANSFDTGIIRMWDTATGELLHLLPLEEGTVFTSEFSPDGQFLLTGGEGIIQLWNLKTGEEVRRFETGDSAQLFDLAFSRDSQWIAAGSMDGTAWLWDVATGQNERHFAGHKGFVKRVAFSPDGKSLFTASVDGTIRIWQTDYRDLIAATCINIFRDLDAVACVHYNILDNEPVCSQPLEQRRFAPTLSPTMILPVWTPLPSPTAIPTIAVLQPDDNGVLYSDDFSADKVGWETDAGAEGIFARLKDGKYVIDITNETMWISMAGTNAPEKAPIFTLPYEMQFDLDHVSTSGNDLGIILVFNSAPDYSFSRMISVYESGITEVVNDFVPDSKFNSKPFELNRAGVNKVRLQVGNVANRVFINDELIVEIPAAEPVNGTIGLGVDTKDVTANSHVEFDNLVIKVLDEIEVSATPTP
jgi:hypothetical protein